MVDKRILITLAFLLCSLDLLAEDKTDVVVMTNGDHFVGEIKKLEFGQLAFKASYMADSVNLDWTKVQRLESVRRFRVELANGELRSGSILKRPSTATSPGDFDVVEDVGTTSVSFLEVVDTGSAGRTIMASIQRKRRRWVHPSPPRADRLLHKFQCRFPCGKFSGQLAGDLSIQPAGGGRRL